MAVAIGAPLVVYLVLSVPLMDWIVDDAGISFAYARNLAHGYGLVSQPGVPPVEGYSNFLWVVILAITFLFRLFDPYVTVKLISFVLVGVTFLMTFLTIRLLVGRRVGLSLLVNLLLAINTSFLVWTVSGLENPLYAALTAVTIYLLSRFTLDESYRPVGSVYAGLAVTALALTRPDGIVYAVAFPIVVVVLPAVKRISLTSMWRYLLRYAMATVLPLGAFLVFRLLYFGYPLPNTYYSKGGTTGESFIRLLTLRSPYPAKAMELTESIFGEWLWWVILLLIAAFIVTRIRRRNTIVPYTGPFAMVLLSLTAFLLLRGDWMGEFRFATPFFVSLYLLLGIALWRLVDLIKSTTSRRVVVLLCAVAVLGLTLSEHMPRYRKFVNSPTTPFENVRRNYADRFNNLARALDLDHASVLLPDIGGTLFYCDLRVYDLAGLCDRRIALTLEKDHKALADYVFEEIKPTFIQVHGWFTLKAKFDDDPRFSRDYEGLSTYEDPWVKSVNGETRRSGIFVRRDAVEDKQAIVDSLKAASQ